MTVTTEKVPVSSWVDRELRQQLQALAIEGDRTLSAEVRRALTAHIEHTTYLERTARRPPEQQP